MKTVITEASTSTLGGRLRIARDAAGYTLRDTEHWLRQHMPRAYWRTPSTILRLEEDTRDEAEVDPMLIAALAWAYGVPVQVLSPMVQQQLEWALQIAHWGISVGHDTEAPANSLCPLLEGMNLPDSEPRSVPFVAGWARPRPVGMGGESGRFTNGLKARCSAIELATLFEVTDIESDRAA